MPTATAQINIPFELLAEAVTTLNIEHKIKLWKFKIKICFQKIVQ